MKESLDELCIVWHIYTFYRPNQDLDVMYDYVVQVLSGRNQIKIHIAAINVDNDVQVRHLISVTLMVFVIINTPGVLKRYY